jgi:hypothetical protein
VIAQAGRGELLELLTSTLHIALPRTVSYIFFMLDLGCLIRLKKGIAKKENKTRECQV